MLAQGWNRTRGVVVACLLTSLTLALAGCQLPNRYARQQGMNAYADQQYDVARNKFTRAIADNSDDWKSLYYLGLIDLHQGQPLSAQLELEKALSIRSDAPETPAILDALAQSLLDQKNYANLAAMLQQATDRYGTSADFLRQGVFLGKSGDVDGAKLAFAKAIRFAAKDDPTPFIALAQFYDSLGLGADALTAWRQAYYVAPDNLQIADAIRRHGMVPGPTVAIEPQR